MNPEEVFEKLIKNQISKEEFEQLLAGLDDEDVLARYEVFLQTQFEEEVKKHFSKLENETKVEEKGLKVTKKYTSKKKLSSTKKSRRDFPIAAVLVLFVGLLFSVLFIISQTKSSVSETKEIVKATVIPEIITKSTPRGRKFRMNLDDGSFVHMNSASSIIYPNKFEGETRDIEIIGEAYFDIKRDELRPFKIKVKDYYVEVLGTSFNIQAFEDEEDFSVTVESGTVKVNLDVDGNNSVVLEKDQKLIFNPNTNVTEIVDVESGAELSWRKGILRFEATPLASVEKTIERWYGVNLIIESSDLYKKTLTGIHQNKNLKSVIEALTYATDSKYIVKNNSIIIK